MIFKFLVTRTLAKEIEFEANSLEEAIEQAKGKAEAINYNNFSDIHKETVELTKAPEEANADSWLHVPISPDIMTF